MKHPHSFFAVSAIIIELLFGPVARADFYVSPSGSDAGAGAISSPFATLEKARDAVRAAKPSGSGSAGAVTVWLRGGVFMRTNALALSARDSGSERAPVIWRGDREERVRLLGGLVLNGFEPVKDPTILSRLGEAARDHVLQIDLRAQGTTNVGDMR